MLRPILILFLATILFSCTDNQSNKNVQLILTDTSKQRDKVISLDTFSIPTTFFVRITSIIDSVGFIPDTNRIKEVGYYAWTIKKSPIFLVKAIPFYKMDTTTNPVFNYINEGLWSSNHYEPDINGMVQTDIFPEFPKAFYKVKNITGFYFRDKNKSETWTDGFIEEWEFNTINDAQNAEKVFNQYYMFIYFNSFAHIFRKDNHLYALYSRSTWDTRRLEKMYSEIIND